MATFAEKISGARLMEAGIRRNLSALASVGLGEADADNINQLAQDISDLDTQQEKLKSDLKLCTAQLKEKTAAIDKAVAHCKKRVKIAVAPEGWTEFGITAKK